MLFNNSLEIKFYYVYDVCVLKVVLENAIDTFVNFVLTVATGWKVQLVIH
jgi:hypothetical protein